MLSWDPGFQATICQPPRLSHDNQMGPSNGKKSLPIPAACGKDNGILLCCTQPGHQREGDDSAMVKQMVR